MSSPISHSAVWFAIWPAVRERTARLSRARRVLLGLAVLGALLAPDADLLPALVFGESIASFHNNGSHSLLVACAFAVPFAFICGAIAGGRWSFFWLVGFLACASHILIDALTFGRGVQAFWPLTDARYGGDFYVFYGVRHSVNAPLQDHILTVLNDLAFAGLIFLLSRWVYRRRRERRHGPRLESIDTRG